MSLNYRIAGILVSVSCATIVAASACQVPVFRYALERWKADPHVVVVAHQGGLSDADKALVQRMGDDAWKCNIEVITVDVTDEDVAAEFPEIEPGAPYPRLVAYYPHGTGQKAPYWQGPFDAGNVDKLLDSPLRQNLLKKITEGDSAVWLLVESGDAAKDDAAEKRLNEMLAAAGDGLQIPDGVITADEAERVLAEQQPVDAKDILQSTIPLMISFSILRMSREEAAGAESILYRMIFGIDPASMKLLEAEPAPVIAPVFGRGRMLPGIPVAEIDEDIIWGACQYLCGECSCEVKSENPGFDLLLKAEWDEILDGNFVIVEKILPPLTGTGDLVAADVAAKPGVAAGAPEAVEGDRVPQKQVAASMKRNIAIFGGAFVLGIVGVSLMIRRNGAS